MKLRALLAPLFSSGELGLVPESYDVVGDIAIIRVPKAIEYRTKEIADAIMQNNKHVKTILHQVSPVSGDFRLRRLEWVLGKKSPYI